MTVKFPIARLFSLAAMLTVTGGAAAQDSGSLIDDGGALQIACQSAQGCGGLLYETPSEEIPLSAIDAWTQPSTWVGGGEGFPAYRTNPTLTPQSPPDVVWPVAHWSSPTTHWSEALTIEKPKPPTPPTPVYIDINFSNSQADGYGGAF